MCDVWHYPTKAEDEISVEDIEKLPSGLRFINITEGEPFIRRDIEEVVAAIVPKAPLFRRQVKKFLQHLG